MSSLHQFVKKALEDFLKQHNIENLDDGVDDIVLEYVVSILAELGQSDCTEDLDMEEFVDVMEAYVPGFGSIGSVQVCEWMFELAAYRPSERKKAVESPDERLQVPEKDTQHGTNVQDVSTTSSLKAEDKNKELKFLSMSQITESSRSQKEDCPDPQIDLLLEMFPESCSLEVKHCLLTAQGDMDTAVQLILHRQDTGKAITKETTHKEQGRVKSAEFSGLKDKELRDQMLARYAFVDETDDHITHKPVAPKQDKKKMVRYLDGRVVSTKGEKFTELKKEEDPEMKKTYVNLKPARKYRFH